VDHDGPGSFRDHRPERRAMHCSVWRFTGDPDALEHAYLALMEQIPAANHVFHAAARTPNGLLIFDTCPSEEAYHAFFGSDEVRAMFAAHGLTDGAVEDFPVVRAFARRAELTDEDWP
jgi:hypothetical protein